MRKSNGKVFKRVCTLALSAALVVGSIYQIPNGLKSAVEEASAGDGYDGIFYCDKNEYHYLNNKNNSGVTLVCVIGEGNIKVPSEVKIDGKTRKITGLQYPFGHMQKASSITVPDSVTTIGDSVFKKADIGEIKLPNTIEKVGNYFCAYSKIGKITCGSKKINSIGDYCFYDSTGTNKVILGDWLIKYTPSGDTLDLGNDDLKELKHSVNGAFSFTDKVTVLKIGNNESLLKRTYFANDCQNYIKEVYVGNGKVKCSKASDTVSDVIKRHYDVFVYSNFDMNYAKDKAKLVLESLGLKYYGPNSKYKGTLSAKKEYEAILKVHNYVVDNYVYDTSANCSYTKVFNCRTVSKCQYDAEMCAFLLECAGVESEVVASGELVKVTKEEREKDPNKRYTIYGEYRVDNYGNHAWNIVKMGNKWYHMDSTEDRSLKPNSLTQFLVSDDYLKDTAKASEKPAHSFLGMHGYPYTEDYRKDEWSKKLYCFQNYNTMLTKTNYHDTYADIDGDMYRTKKDEDYLQAYIMLPDSLKNVLSNVAAGKTANSEDIKKINGCKGKKGQVIFIDSKGKCTIDLKRLDVDFDNKVTMSDLMSFSSRANNELYYKIK